MELLQLKRVFKHNGKEIEDPNPSMTPTEIAKLLSSKFAELTNATITGPKYEKDKEIYEFSVTAARKG